MLSLPCDLASRAQISGHNLHGGGHVSFCVGLGLPLQLPPVCVNHLNRCKKLLTLCVGISSMPLRRHILSVCKGSFSLQGGWSRFAYPVQRSYGT